MSCAALEVSRGTLVKAPRDVIERATQMWVPVTADSFPASSSIAAGTLTTPYGAWTVTTQIGGGASVGQSGGVALTATTSVNSFASIRSSIAALVATGAWSATASISSWSVPVGATLLLAVGEGASSSTGDAYGIALAKADAQFVWSNTGIDGLAPGTSVMYEAQIASSASLALSLESDGEWVFAFVNGQLIGAGRRQHSAASHLLGSVKVWDNSGGVAANATVTEMLVKALQPFLQPAASKGDYMLPVQGSDL